MTKTKMCPQFYLYATPEDYQEVKRLESELLKNMKAQLKLLQEMLKIQESLPDSEQGVEDYHRNNKWNRVWSGYNSFEWWMMFLIGFIVGFIVAIILLTPAIISVIPN